MQSKLLQGNQVVYTFLMTIILFVSVNIEQVRPPRGSVRIFKILFVVMYIKGYQKFLQFINNAIHNKTIHYSLSMLPFRFSYHFDVLLIL